MKTAAVIAEFNPFHNGHEYLIRQAKNAGYDFVLVIMSGCYVQRGEPAVADRYLRTEMALRGGADAVIALPTRYAVSSAESFAAHSVRLLDASASADALFFGSESGDIEGLTKCAEILADESEDYQKTLRDFLKSGMSFPRARVSALPEYAELLSQPNNILAVEYIKALIRTDSAMKAVTVKRVGEGHGSMEIAAFSSAGAVRGVLSQGGALPKEPFREDLYQLLYDYFENGPAVQAEDLSFAAAEKLVSAMSARDLEEYQEVTRDLANTMWNNRYRFEGFLSFADLCAGRSITVSHVRRALLSIALGIKKRKDLPDFLHILGFRTEASPLIAKITSKASCPVVINPARDAGRLESRAAALFEEERRVTEIYDYMRRRRSGEEIVPFYSRPVIKV